MDTLYKQRSHYPKGKQETKWISVDAEDKVLGRLASRIAHRLMGKHLPTYQPGVLMGDSVVVLNAAKVKLTGNKIEQKEYKWHSGYLGGLKSRSVREQFEKAPEEVIKKAVQGMLPKNSYGRQLLTRIRVFAGVEHNLDAQKPEPVELI